MVQRHLWYQIFFSSGEQEDTRLLTAYQEGGPWVRSGQQRESWELGSYYVSGILKVCFSFNPLCSCK